MMLDSDFQNNFGVFVCLLYTSGFTFYVNTKYQEKLSSLPLFFLILPIGYLLAFAFFNESKLFLFSNPILYGLIFVVFILFFVKNLTERYSVFFIVFFAYLYSYYGYEYFKIAGNQEESMMSSVEKRYLNDEINLKTYRFLDYKKDTVNIKANRLILIETWNETCPPCIRSINDLQPTIDSLSSKLQHIYLYESPTFGKKTDFSDVINFNLIQNKEKIYIDYNLQFFTEIGMNSYPVFLLFNREGVLVDYFTGYSSNEKEYFKKRIKNMASY